MPDDDFRIFQITRKAIFEVIRDAYRSRKENLDNLSLPDGSIREGELRCRVAQKLLNENKELLSALYGEVITSRSSNYLIQGNKLEFIYHDVLTRLIQERFLRWCGGNGNQPFNCLRIPADSKSLWNEILENDHFPYCNSELRAIFSELVDPDEEISTVYQEASYCLENGLLRASLILLGVCLERSISLLIEKWDKLEVNDKVRKKIRTAMKHSKLSNKWKEIYDLLTNKGVTDWMNDNPGLSHTDLDTIEEIIREKRNNTVHNSYSPSVAEVYVSMMSFTYFYQRIIELEDIPPEQFHN